jgi:hypothetical protein
VSRLAGWRVFRADADEQSLKKDEETKAAVNKKLV